MKNWLAEKFIPLGIASAICDVGWRFLSKFGFEYIASIAVENSWTFNQTLIATYAIGALDILASAFWWAFIFGLAFRILAHLEKAGSAEPAQ